MKSGILALAVAMALTSCATALPPKAPPPAQASSTASVVSESLPTLAEKFAATDLEDTYFGVSGASGSAAVGAMFGMIGVLANVAYVKAENRSRAEGLDALTSIDLGDLLEAELHAHGAGSAAAPAFVLTPSANLYFRSETEYWLTCSLTVEQPSTEWTARYSIAVDGLMDASDPADTLASREKIETCIGDVAGLYAAHVDGAIGAFEPRIITSARLDGKGDIDQTLSIAVSALPNRIIVNDAFGLTQLRKSELKGIQEAPAAAPAEKGA